MILKGGTPMLSPCLDCEYLPSSFLQFSHFSCLSFCLPSVLPFFLSSSYLLATQVFERNSLRRSYSRCAFIVLSLIDASFQTVFLASQRHFPHFDVLSVSDASF